MLVLAIESSCDDTSAAVVRRREILSNIVSSQDSVHAEFGGVVPELAARCHLEFIGPVIRRALETAEVDLSDLDAIAVTRGPGLVGSLVVGISAAQGLACRAAKPLFGVNHLEAHVLSPLLEHDIPFPFLALLVSGGHTSLYWVRGVGDYAEVASTRDDAAGEAFDKAAKMMGLGYPGGRVVDERAKKGRIDRYDFPRARVRADRMALSFSGLKTALWDLLRKSAESCGGDTGEVLHVDDLCASFQEAIVDALLDRVRVAVRELGVSTVVVAGGVSANSRLRDRMTESGRADGFDVKFPSMALCTDNAAMVAGAAICRAEAGLGHDLLEAASRLPMAPKLRRE